MKKKVICILVLALLVSLIVLIWNMLNYSMVLKHNWGISLPFYARFSKIYDKSSESSFHGDGIRYHIYAYKDEKYVNSMFEWMSTEHSTIFYLSFSEAINNWLQEIDVPKEYYPNYDHCIYWYEKQDDNSEIIIILNNFENKLYIVESLL